MNRNGILQQIEENSSQQYQSLTREMLDTVIRDISDQLDQLPSVGEWVVYTGSREYPLTLREAFAATQDNYGDSFTTIQDTYEDNREREWYEPEP